MKRVTSRSIFGGKKGRNNSEAARRRSSKLAVLASAAAIVSMSHNKVFATTYTWDPGNTPTTPSGGTGTWDLATSDWSNGTGDVAWTDTTGANDTAVFAGTAGTVSQNANLGAAEVLFQAAGYAISSGSNILLLGTAGTQIDTSAIGSGTAALGNVDIGAAAETWNVGAAALTLNGAVRDNAQSSTTLTVNGTGTTQMSGGLTFASGNFTARVTIAGSENINVSGLVQDGNNGGNFLTYDGTGTLSLTGTTNTFGTGTSRSQLAVDSGVVAIASAGSLGSALNPLVLGNNTATATFQGIGSGTISIANPVTLGGGGGGTSVIGGSTPLNFTGTVTGQGSKDDLNVNNTALTTFSGNFYLGGSGSRTVLLGGTGSLLVSAPIGDTPSGPGPCSLNYNGTGTLTLTNTNTFTGNLGVEGGTVVVSSDGALGSASSTLWLGPVNGGTPGGAGTFQGTGTSTLTIAHAVEIDTSTADNVTLAGTTPLLFTNTVTFDTNSSTSNTVIVNDTGGIVWNAPVFLATGGTSRTTTFGGANNITINGVIATGASGVTTVANLVYSGTGTMTVSNANTYSGSTTVNSGVFDVTNTSGSATSTGNLTMNGGTLASGSVGSIAGNVLTGATASAYTIAPGGVGNVGTLTLGGLTSSTLTTLSFQLGTGSGVVSNGSQLILGSGTVSIGAGTALTFGGVPIGGNDYELIGGSIGGISLSNFTLPAAPVGLAYALAVNSGFIDLDVTSSGPVGLTWDNAAGTGLWNTSDKNWNNGGATYSDGSNVTFNDNNGGGANYSVTLNSVVSPGSVTVNNSGGSYTIGGSGSIVGGGSLSKSGTSSLVINTKGTSLGAVSVTGGSVQLGSSTGLATIASLSVGSNATFDVNNNHVIIDYGSGPDPISSIAALLKTGYNHGNWNGIGGIISTAAQVNNTTPGNLLYGVGYADSADSGNPAGLSAGTIEIKYTLLGDANLSGVVDGTDFGIVAANFNKGVTGWDQGDFNYDNVVDGTDFGDLAANFNKGASGAAAWQALEAFAAANGLLADVPEPASVGLVAVGVVGVLSRRRRGKVN